MFHLRALWRRLSDKNWNFPNMAKAIFIRFANTNCDYRDSLVSFEIISPRGARTLKIGSKAQYSLPKRFPMTCKILSETITHIKKCLFACIWTYMGPIMRASMLQKKFCQFFYSAFLVVLFRCFCFRFECMLLWGSFKSKTNLFNRNFFRYLINICLALHWNWQK